MKYSILLCVLLTVSPIRLFSDIIIAPTAIFLNDSKKAASVIIHNDGYLPKEITVEIRYGYPISNLNGETIFQFISNPAPEDPSATQWTDAFPRRFTLAPGERQVVRLMVRPPHNLPDGEYWARPIFTAQDLNPVSASSRNSNAINSVITTTFQSVISIYYRHGIVKTGITASLDSVQVENNKIHYSMQLKREGNAAFLGTLTSTVRNMNGDVVVKESKSIAVYYNLRPSLQMDIAKIPRGHYTFEISIDTSRSEAEQKDILKAQPYVASIAITL